LNYEILPFVIPALSRNPGFKSFNLGLDSRFRGNDRIEDFVIQGK